MSRANRKLEPVRPGDEKKYYEESKAWDQEKYESERKRGNVAWIIAGVSVVISILLVFAVIGLTPLKTVEPYIVEVNKTTGQVEVKKPLKEGVVEKDEALDKYFINKYLLARMQYDRQSAEEDYQVVAMMSSQNVFREYYNNFNPQNPESPLVVYGKNAKVRIKPSHISYIDDDTVSVRLEEWIERKNADPERPKYKVVTLSFQYLNEPKKEEDRYINPLGFEVTSYREDDEVYTGE